MVNYSRIWACFVLYNPGDSHHLLSISQVVRTGARIIVYDNSDLAYVSGNKQAILDISNEVVFLGGEGNIGLSAAFNKVVSYLKETSSADAFVIFDQDSSVTQSIFSDLVGRFFDYSKRFDIGVYAAQPVREGGVPYRIRRVNVKTPDPCVVASEFAASSFSLIPMAAIEKVGGFYDDFFIDHIDADFCKRCWRKSLAVFIDTRLKYTHRVGVGDVKFFGKAIMPVSAPFRGYYQTRNILLSGFRGGDSCFSISRKLAFKLIKIFIVAVFSGNALLRINFALRGVFDGIKGRSGSLR